jgi:hypothetical protein
MINMAQDYEKVLEKLEPNSFDKNLVLLFTKEAKVYKWYNSEYEFRSGISWLKSLELSVVIPIQKLHHSGKYEPLLQNDGATYPKSEPPMTALSFT